MARKPRIVEPGFLHDNWRLLVMLLCLFFSTGIFYATAYHERQRPAEEDLELYGLSSNRIAILNSADALATVNKSKTEMEGNRQQFEQLQRDFINLKTEAQQLRFDVDAFPKPKSLPPPPPRETVPSTLPPEQKP